jgi:hypothetical protein
MTAKHMYRQGWEDLKERVRSARAQGRCECVGECAQHGDGSAPQRCEEMQGEQAKIGKGTINLALAHVCDEPGCLDEAHLRAMCQRCHLHFYNRVVDEASGRRLRRRKHTGQVSADSAPRRRLSDLTN